MFARRDNLCYTDQLLDTAFLQFGGLSAVWVFEKDIDLLMVPSFHSPRNKPGILEGGEVSECLPPPLISYLQSGECCRA